MTCSSGLYLHTSDNHCSGDCYSESSFFEAMGSNGQFYNVELCEKCHSKCQTCSGEHSNDCLSCADADHYFHTSDHSCKGFCSTFSDYFISNDGAECSKCHKSCKGCVSSSRKSCLGCEAGDYLHTSDTHCSPKCTETNGLFVSDKSMLDYEECRPCYSSCQICSSSSFSDCSQCIDGYFLKDENKCERKCESGVNWGNPLNNECQEKCPSGYYGNPKSTHCVLASDCPSDYPLASLETRLCSSFCDTSFYYKSGRCLPCDHSCLKCSGPSENECTACQPPEVLSQGTCLNNCHDYSFYSDEINECLSCTRNCKTCVNGFECLECGNDYSLDSDTALCVQTCPDGQYSSAKSDGSLVCLACHHKCLTCYLGTSDSCLSCESPLAYYQDECVSSCPSTTYYLSTENRCLVSCPEGFYESSHRPEDDNMCLECDKGCKTCNGAYKDNCLSCEAPLLLLSSSCVSECPDEGYVLNGLSCLECPKGCAKCYKSADKCYKCFPGYDFDSEKSKCYSGCAKGSYLSSDGICQECIDNCESCSGRTISDCSECEDDFIFIEDWGCLNDCPSSTFLTLSSDGQTSCKDCSSGCEACVDEDECLECLSGKWKVDSKCISKCPDDMVSLGESNECKRCSDMDEYVLYERTTCVKCQSVEGLKLNSEGKCIDICGDGFRFHELGSYSGILSFNECDDGNLIPSDGCSPLCEVEEGFECFGPLTSPDLCQVLGTTSEELTLSVERENEKSFKIKFDRALSSAILDPVKQGNLLVTIKDFSTSLYSAIYVWDPYESTISITFLFLKLVRRKTVLFKFQKPEEIYDANNNELSMAEFQGLIEYALPSFETENDEATIITVMGAFSGSIIGFGALAGLVSHFTFGLSSGFISLLFESACLIQSIGYLGTMDVVFPSGLEDFLYFGAEARLPFLNPFSGADEEETQNESDMEKIESETQEQRRALEGTNPDWKELEKEEGRKERKLGEKWDRSIQYGRYRFSTNILENSGQFLILWVTLCAFAIMISCLVYRAKKRSREMKRLERLDMALRWNLFFFLYRFCMTDLLMFSFVQMFSMDGSVKAIISLIISLALIPLMLLVLYLKARILRRLDTHDLNPRTSAIYSDSDLSRLSGRYFDFFESLKVLIIALTFSLFWFSRVTQVILLFLTHLTFIIYLLKTKPLRSKSRLARELVSSIGFSLALWFVFLLAVDESAEFMQFAGRESIGWIIVSIFILVILIYMIEIILTIFQRIINACRTKETEASNSQTDKNYSRRATFNNLFLQTPKGSSSRVKSLKTTTVKKMNAPTKEVTEKVLLNKSPKKKSNLKMKKIMVPKQINDIIVEDPEEDNRVEIEDDSKKSVFYKQSVQPNPSFSDK